VYCRTIASIFYEPVLERFQDGHSITSLDESQH
jgi:hypothetical protein